MNTHTTKMRATISSLAVAILTAACANGEPGAPSGTAVAEEETELIERARGIHDRVITLDTHNDIDTADFTEARNYTMDLPTQVNLPKMAAGGLDVSWLIVFTGQEELTDPGYATALGSAIEHFEAIHRLTEEIAPDQIELALTSDDVRRIITSGKKVAMIGVENAYPVGMDLANIERFHEMGARYMSLAHNGHSQFADSNTGEEDGIWLHGGLSDLGREAIAELNRVGIMIDLSHPSKEANLETLALSRAPVIASHTSARAIGDVSRNMDDEQLLAIKENGGVVQTVAFSSYLLPEKNTPHSDARTALEQSVGEAMGVEVVDREVRFRMPEEERAAYEEAFEPVEEAVDARLEAEVNPVAPPVDVSDFVDHIDYMVDLIGIEHVGISSDFDGGGGVWGWDDASETLNVTVELVRRGYSEEQIGLLWSGNLLRVLDEVQAIAAEIQAEG